VPKVHRKILLSTLGALTTCPTLWKICPYQKFNKQTYLRRNYSESRRKGIHERICCR